MKKTIKTILAIIAIIAAISLIGHSGFANAVIRSPFTSDYTI